MSDTICMTFQSELRAPASRVWEWITSVKGISAEMWPYFRMTAPRNVRTLNDLPFRPGQRLFRSYLFLFGALPIDYSDMTLIELDPGNGFVEQSPMGSMKLWRHERRILASTSDPEVILLIDRLTFQPRIARWLAAWFIRRIFQHRHKILCSRFHGTKSE